MSGRLSRIGAALFAAAAVAAVVAPAASAVLPENVGWWNKTQQIPTVPVAGTVNLPLPPGVSSDDLPVATDGTPEALLIAALRYDVPEGASAKLTLTETNGRALTMPPGTSISVCPATSPWDGLINGRWDSRPKYDCGALSAVSSPVAEGVALTWDLPPSFQTKPGVIDVVLVPSGSPLPFIAVFNTPTDESLVLVDVPETSEDPTGEETTAPLDFDSGTFSALPSLGGLDDFSTELPPLSASGDPPRTLGPAGTVRPPIGNLLGPSDSRAERTLAFLLLLVLAGALFWFGGHPVRDPRLLGSLGHGQVAAKVAQPVAGVGRFARPRGGSDA